MAREGLFNILANRIDFQGMRVLDLFGGTGSISLEFASRGAASIDYVEKKQAYCSFLGKTTGYLGIESIRIHRTDVFRFLERRSGLFDLVFADPPYDLVSLPDLPSLILGRDLLIAEGTFILEHGRKNSFGDLPGFMELRRYGSVHFSFFKGECARKPGF